MSSISIADVKKLALLARLEIDDVDVEKYQRELQSIFEYIEKLQSVDTEGLEPTYQVNFLHNATRNDEIVDYGTTQASLLKNVPATEGKLIKVQRMVG